MTVLGKNHHFFTLVKYKSLINLEHFMCVLNEYYAYLDVPVLPKRSDNALLYRPAARTADRNAHLIVAPQAE